MRLVVAAGMRRGGSTLQSQYLLDLLQRCDRSSQIEYLPEIARADLELPAGRDCRLIKSHKAARCDRRCFGEVGATVVYITRDPRDCLVSHLRKYGKPYSDEAAAKFLGQLRSEFGYWTSGPLAHWARYERVLADPATEVRALAAALDIDVDDSAVASIVANRSIEQQQQRIASFDWVEDAVVSGVDRIDPRSQLHRNHIHGGEIDGWKRILDRAATRTVESRFGELIEALGYRLTTSRLERISARVRRFFRHVHDGLKRCWHRFRPSS